MTTEDAVDTINLTGVSAQIQIYDDLQNNTVLINELTVGQIIRVVVTVIADTPTNIVQLNTCSMVADGQEIQIISAGQPVSVFNSSVWVLESTSNTASFKLRAFSIGRLKSRKLMMSALITDYCFR